MNSLQCLKHEWLCQKEKIEKEEVKNNQEDHSSSGKKDPELNTTKQNLSQNKGQWDPAHNYVMFDCETRTMSRADPRDDSDDGENENLCNNNNNVCNHDNDSNKENEKVNENSTEPNRLSQTSVSSANCDNNSNDCRKRVADGADNDYLEATVGYRKRSKTPLVDAGDNGEESNNLTKLAPLNQSTVITHDQVQQRAQEIRESKRMSGISFDSLEDSCSIAIKSKDSNHFNEMDDASAHADDEQTATEGPTPTPDVSEISIPCVPRDSNLEQSAIPVATRLLLNGQLDFKNSNPISELSEQTLWQAAEGTITPMFEVANVSHLGSIYFEPCTRKMRI